MPLYNTQTVWVEILINPPHHGVKQFYKRTESNCTLPLICDKHNKILYEEKFSFDKIGSYERQAY